MTERSIFMEPDWVRALFERRRFGMHPGLRGIQALLEALDHPEKSLAAVHIAGTNGKGTVAALVSAVLTAAGYRTGRYTSPHFIRFNERFCIDGRPMDDAALASSAQAVLTAAADIENGMAQKLTFFECATAMAFHGFRSSGIKIAVLETGMGGRFDATNVICPLVSVITRIGLDHTQWLGSTLEAIAAEKAGIIKPQRPVVIGAMPTNAARIIAAEALRCHSILRRAEDHATVRICHADWTGLTVHVETTERAFGRMRIPLAGAFQAENVATAVTTCDVLSSFLPEPIAEEAVRDGMAAVQWPGRFHCVCRDPRVVVDGAHNPLAMEALLHAIRHLAPDQPLGVVFGACSDKDTEAIIRKLVPESARVWTVPILSDRSADPTALTTVFDRWGVTSRSAPSFRAAAEEACAWAQATSGVVVVCGSLFLAAEALKHYGVLSATETADPNESMTDDTKIH